MTVSTLISLLIALGYGLLPYSLAIYMLQDRISGSGIEKSIRAIAMGMVLFCLVGHAWVSVSLESFIMAHAILTWLIVIIFAVSRRKLKTSISATRQPSIPIILLMAGVFCVRIIPPLLSKDWLGCIDARFHNILAQSILQNGHLPYTWQPFADIPVAYPLGTHAMMTFLAVHSGAPVHHAFSILLAFTGSLTAGVLFLMALRIFNNRESAMFAAATYGFLPIMGSLGYLAWGGLPNTVGMLFLCISILLLLETHSMESSSPIAWLYMLICLAGIRCAHHYSFLVMLLMLVAQFMMGPTPKLRRISGWLILMTLLLVMASSIPEILNLRTGLTNSGTLKFPEPSITLFRIVLDMNPAFVLLACFAYYLAVRAPSINTPQSFTVPCVFLLGWIASLFGAFVFLEYIYRAAVLIITGGRECYVALTPSRMATDLVYPMSLLCGMVPLWDKWQKYRRPFLALFSVAAAATVIFILHSQQSIGTHPGSRCISDWISKNTNSRALIVGLLPHLEYLTWRETSHPPIPASEERNSSAVTWKRSIRYYKQWIAWERATGRQVYYLVPDSDKPDSPLPEKVFASHGIAIMKHIASPPSEKGNP